LVKKCNYFYNTHVRRYNNRMKNMKRFGMLLAAAVILLVIALAMRHHGQPATPGSKQAFNKHELSLSDPSSAWLVVNKTRPLQPKDFAPSLAVPNVPLRLASDNEEMHLRPDAARALETLVSGAKQQGIRLMLASGYRSYNFQVSLYNGYVMDQGQAEADQQSARPGYSEHQTGMAADLEPTSRNCEVVSCFATTPEGKWLAANAYRYGFILRYPEGKQAVTGYEYEPWHIRFVGTTLSQEMHRDHVLTMEEFFGLPAAPKYQ